MTRYMALILSVPSGVIVAGNQKHGKDNLASQGCMWTVTIAHKAMLAAVYSCLVHYNDLH